MNPMIANEILIRSLDELLEGSQAEADFKKAVRALAEGSPPGDRIQVNPGCPAVKILRLAMKLLEDNPSFKFERLRVDARSGCSDFVGRAIAEPGSTRFDFEWDCRWRAEQLGWIDAFGEPDQIRAARVYGYQCFKRLERVNAPPSHPSKPSN
jgi:hypothetical protein